MNKKILLLVTILLSGTMTFAGVVANQKGKCGYQDENGNMVIDYKYDFIGNFSDNGLARVKSGSKYGLINRQGTIVLPVSYDDIGLFHDGIATLTSGKKVGLIKEDGTILLKPTYVEISHFNQQGIAFALINAKKQSYALINKEGSVLIKTFTGTYFRQLNLDGTVTKVDFDNDSIDTRSGYMVNEGLSTTYYNLKGEVVMGNEQFQKLYLDMFNTKFKSALSTPFSGLWHGVISVKEDIALCHMAAQTDKNTYSFAVVYFDLIKQQKLASYVFTKSKKEMDAKILDEEYKLAVNNGDTTDGATLSFAEKIASRSIVYLNRLQKGEFYSGLPFVNGFAIVTHVQNDSQTSILINTSGQQVGEYALCLPYFNGYAIVGNQDKLYGVIDINQQLVVPYMYSAISTYNSTKGISPTHYFGVQDAQKKWGVVDVTTNTVVVPFKFSQVDLTESNVSYVEQNSKWGAYAADKVELNCDNDSLLWTVGSSILAYKNSKYYVYDFASKRTSSLYDGRANVYAADDKLHGGAFYEMTLKDDTITYIGYVNALAQEVIPTVFVNKDAAYKAYKYYSTEPLHEFSEIDRYRLPLRFSLRERTYHLTDIVPDQDWDY